MGTGKGAWDWEPRGDWNGGSRDGIRDESRNEANANGEGISGGSREPFWWRLGVAGVRDEQCAHGINRVVLEFVQGIELQRWDEAGCRFMLWQNRSV